ncbi:hypothetical protein [Thalassospira mesophila]|nr:hypothetical protein [Thalassospira mesophila]
MSSFEPNSDGTFRYEVMKSSSDGVYNEADRLNWLQMYLDDNALCPNGYEITEKKNILVQKSFIGDAYREIIYGRCT